MITFTMALLLSMPALAGGKGLCADTKVTEDRFTHSKVSQAGQYFPLVSPERELGWQVTTTDNTASLSVMLSKLQAHDSVLPAGYLVKFLMKDGAIIELASSAESVPVQGIFNSTTIYTTWLAPFAVSKEVLVALAAQEVVAIRAPHPAGDVTWESGRGLKDLNSALACAASLAP